MCVCVCVCVCDLKEIFTAKEKVESEEIFFLGGVFFLVGEQRRWRRIIRGDGNGCVQEGLIRS